MDILEGMEIHKEMSEGTRTTGCYSCGLAYGSDRWVDVTLLNDIWSQISPTGGSGGLFCFQCIVEELAKKNLKTTVKLYGGTMTSLDSFYQTPKEKMRSRLFRVETFIHGLTGWRISLYKRG